MSARVLAETLAECVGALLRLMPIIARIEANQQAIMSADRTAYSHIQQFLTGHGQQLDRIETRQIKIESAQVHHRASLNMIAVSHGEALGRLEGRQEVMAASMEKSVPSHLKLAEKAFEWGLKVLSHWAPISAAGVATYKFLWPYARQALGLS